MRAREGEHGCECTKYDVSRIVVAADNRRDRDAHSEQSDDRPRKRK